MSTMDAVLSVSLIDCGSLDKILTMNRSRAAAEIITIIIMIIIMIIIIMIIIMIIIIIRRRIKISRALRLIFGLKALHSSATLFRTTTQQQQQEQESM